jgi:aspartate aminotransferase-like enzyme
MTHLFLPGPVNVAPQVLAAQARPMLPFDSQEFIDIYKRAEENCRKLFLTRHPVQIYSAGQSAMQEAGVRNFVRRSLLCCVNGAASLQWAETARENGLQPDILEAEWGQPTHPEQLETALRQKKYEAVTITHVETSTGVQNPLSDLVAIARSASPTTLLLVDASASLGGVSLETDTLELDFVFTISHNCLALPPGLAFACVSPRAHKKAETIIRRGYTFDLTNTAKNHDLDSTHASTPQSLIFALDLQLERILDEGIENRFLRHSTLSQRVEDVLQTIGFHLFAAEQYRSETLICTKNTLGWSFSDLERFLLTHGMRIANGFGMLKEKTFRIAIMGETNSEDIDMLINALKAFHSKRP